MEHVEGLPHRRSGPALSFITRFFSFGRRAAAGWPQGGGNRVEEKDARDIKEFVEVCARTF
jgi:hypothetical protein